MRRADGVRFAISAGRGHFLTDLRRLITAFITLDGRTRSHLARAGIQRSAAQRQLAVTVAMATERSYRGWGAGQRNSIRSA